MRLNGWCDQGVHNASAHARAREHETFAWRVQSGEATSGRGRDCVRVRIAKGSARRERAVGRIQDRGRYFVARRPDIHHPKIYTCFDALHRARRELCWETRSGGEGLPLLRTTARTPGYKKHFMVELIQVPGAFSSSKSRPPQMVYMSTGCAAWEASTLFTSRERRRTLTFCDVSEHRFSIIAHVSISVRFS